MPVTPLRRITDLTLAVLSVLLRDNGEWYGLAIAEQIHHRTGPVYTALARLEVHGWVTSRWEEPGAKNRSGATRKFYSLTPEGRARAMTALREHQRRAERVQRTIALLARAQGHAAV